MVQVISIAEGGNNVFNFNTIGLVNKSIENPAITDITTVLKSNADDITPVNLNGMYVGANHGFPKTYKLTCVHGKTDSDVGSTWIENGTNIEFYIVKIIDTNNLLIISKNYSSVDGTWDIKDYTGGLLTHFTGATNTASITPTSYIADQLYPVIKNKNISIKGDNVDIVNDGTYLLDELNVVESYYINDLDSVLTYLSNNVGKTDVDNISVDNMVRVENRYSFKNNNSCIIETLIDFNKNTPITYIGGVQSQKINGSTIKMYIPKTKLYNSQDFSLGVDITSNKSFINITQPYWENPSIIPNRFIQYSSSFGMAVGYIGGENRSVTNAITISSANKMYPYFINGVTKDKNNIIKFKSYRCFSNPNLDADATSIYWYKENGDIYLYLDYHKNVTKSLDLGFDFYNKNIEIVESKNFNLSNLLLTNTIDFSIINNYGYAILKIS